MRQAQLEHNIVLIGMPGAGKSTAGVLLAKALSRNFLDVDVMIQAASGRRLQDILDREGISAFLAVEERALLEIGHAGHVIATGGSAVYSDAGMAHLKKNGIIVHLDLPLGLLKERLANLDSRGVVMDRGQSLEALYHERTPLYRTHADVTVNCAGLTHDQVVQAAVTALGEAGNIPARLRNR